MPYINDVYIPEDRYMDLSGVEGAARFRFMLLLRYAVCLIIVCGGCYLLHAMIHSRKAFHNISPTGGVAPYSSTVAVANAGQWMLIDWQYNYSDSTLDDLLEDKIAEAYWNSRLLGQKQDCMKGLPDKASLVEGSYRYHVTLSNEVRSWDLTPCVSVHAIDPRIQNDISNKVLRFDCFAGKRQAIGIITSRSALTNFTHLRTFVIGDGRNYLYGPKVYAAKCIAALILDDILRQQSNALCMTTNRNAHALQDTILGRYRAKH